MDMMLALIMSTTAMMNSSGMDLVALVWYSVGGTGAGKLGPESEVDWNCRQHTP